MIPRRRQPDAYCTKVLRESHEIYDGWSENKAQNGWVLCCSSETIDSDDYPKQPTRPHLHMHAVLLPACLERASDIAHTLAMKLRQMLVAP
jgi:hypothetical protein